MFTYLLTCPGPTRWSEIADFRSLFARSDSTVTPSKKSSINTNRKSTTRFPVIPRWMSYVLPKTPKGAQKRKVSKIWTISCKNSETVRDMISVILLITNRKSHTGFRLVPTLMTLNDLERRNSPYFAFFSPNSIDFQADYITVVEERLTMSVK